MTTTQKRYWDQCKTVPAQYLKLITGSRLKGMSDISPQWRYEIMTDMFGPCGTGWKYTIDKLWLEDAPGGERFAFALVSFYYKEGETWSEAIPGIGGSMLVEQETKGLHSNDEAYKMAVTDALSVALKMIGVGADVYMGKLETKYTKQTEDHKPEEYKPPVTQKEPPPQKEQQSKDKGVSTAKDDLHDGLSLYCQDASGEIDMVLYKSVLKEISSFPDAKGKILFIDDINKASEGWCGKTLTKLRNKMAGDNAKNLYAHDLS